MKFITFVFLSTSFCYVHFVSANNSVKNKASLKSIFKDNSQESYASNSLTAEALDLKKEEGQKVALLKNQNLNHKNQKNSFFKEKSILEIGLEYPLHFGLNFKYYLADSIYSRFGLSFVNELFLDSFVKLMPFFGYFNNEEAELMSKLINNSIYMDWRLGWFPYHEDKNGGPYLEFGLSGMALGGGDVSGLTLSKVLDESEFNTEDYYGFRTSTFNGSFHIGYQVPLERLRFNVEAGAIKIMKASLKDIQDDDGLTGQKMNQDQKKSVQAFLKNKGWIFPTVSASFGLSF